MSTTTDTPTANSTSDTSIQALKESLRATWTAGDYDYFSRYMESSAVEFFDRLERPSGTSFLDVACGSGQLALVAARRGFEVTGVDIATNSIEAARGRALFENLDARFDEGDAEALPYANASFDTVATLYGAMFAPRPELVASELLRVTRPGGVVAMANWNAEGFIGELFRVIARFISPPGMPSPLLWGDRDTVRKRFASGVSDLGLTTVTYTFEYPFPPAGVVELFRKYYGPTRRGFDSLGAEAQAGLRGELEDLWTSRNEATDGTTRITSEYLEVVATRA